MWELGSQFRRACINGNGARWRAQIGVENTQNKIQSEPIFRGFWIAPFWESWDLGVVSPSPWSIAISDLAEICEIIYGAQLLTGKVLDPKQLAFFACSSCILPSPWRYSALSAVERKGRCHIR